MESREITVGELDRVCETLFQKRAEYDELKTYLEQKSKEIDDLEATLTFILESHNKEKYHLPNLGTISVVQKMSFRVPKDPQSKSDFFDYLKGKGVFEDLITVNSQTLNAYLKEEMAAADRTGEEFEIPPGIDNPTSYKSLQIRREKS